MTKTYFRNILCESPIGLCFVTRHQQVLQRILSKPSELQLILLPVVMPRKRVAELGTTGENGIQGQWQEGWAVP